MVGLEPLTCPVGPTEVMMIVRLEPPRPPDLLLPGPLRLLTRFQLPRSDVNVAAAGRWSAPPLLSESDHQTTKRIGEAGVAWFLEGEEKSGMRTGYPARRSPPNRPNLVPSFLYL